MSHSWDLQIFPFEPTNTPAQIEEQSGGIPVPLGRHEFICLGILTEPQYKSMDAYVNGNPCPYDAVMAKVTFALKTNPSARITDNFVFPPNSPSQLPAWLNGSKEPGGYAGFWSNKFVQFVGRLGFEWPEGSTIPSEACQISNWVNRPIIATVVAGKSYTNSMGETREGQNQIKLFSYELAQNMPIQIPSASSVNVIKPIPPKPIPPKPQQQTFLPPTNRGAYGYPTMKPSSPPTNQQVYNQQIPRSTDGLEAY